MIALGSSEVTKVFLGNTRVYSVMFMGENILPALLQDQMWYENTSLSSARDGARFAAYGDNIYIVCGYIGTSMSVLHDVYNTVSDTYSSVAYLPRFRTNPVNVTLGDYIYSLGGMTATTTADGQIYRYDIANNSWAMRTFLSEDRGEAAGAVYDGKIYILGGRGNGDDAKFADVEVYDPDTNTVSTFVAMDAHKRKFGAATIGDNIYSIAGCTSSDSATALCEVLNMTTQTWSSIQSTPLSLYDNGVAAYGGKVYSVGGNRGSVVTGVSVFYDPDTNTWTSLSSMLNPRAVHALTEVNGALYAIGGYSDTDVHNNSNEKYVI